MPVHASSVISTTINTFDSALYTSLTDKENQVYTAGTNGRLTEMQASFTKLNDSIVAWMDVSRESKLRDFITGLYSYKTMAQMYGTVSSLLASSDSRSVFTMNGYRSRIQTDAIGYYDDYPTIQFDSTTNTIIRSEGSWVADGFTSSMEVTVTGSVSNNALFTITDVTALELTVTGAMVNEGPSPFIKVVSGSVSIVSTKIQIDIALINGGVAVENTTIDNLSTGFKSPIAGKIHDLLFQDMAVSSGLTKLQMAQYIFNDLHYSEVYSNLNVGTLTLPPLS
jgi:hypothetical protein